MVAKAVRRASPKLQKGRACWFSDPANRDLVDLSDWEGSKIAARRAGIAA